MERNKSVRSAREEILNHPSYWVEFVNAHLYDAIINFMDANSMKQADLAKHLGVSPGRISQILNTGDMNFSIDKIVDIALKVDQFPVFKFESKTVYLKNEEESSKKISFFVPYNFYELSEAENPKKNKTKKVISINANSESKLKLAL